jgi:hypothetical protein
VILNLLEAATGEPVREAVWSPCAPLHPFIPQQGAVSQFNNSLCVICDYLLVSYDKHRDAAVIQDLKQIHYFGSRFCIKIACGLVGEQYGWFVYECAGNSHSLLLPTRQLAGFVVQPMTEPNPFKSLNSVFAWPGKATAAIIHER